MYFLRQHRKFNLSRTADPVLHCTVWSCWTKQNKQRLQTTVRAVEKIIGGNLPIIQHMYNPESGNVQAKVLQSPNSLTTTYSKSLPRVGTIEHFTPKQTDKETL